MSNNQPESYRIIIADDEPSNIKNIKMKIANTSSCFEVIGEANNGLEALEMIRKLNPHVLITDIQMPQMDGIELIKQVSRLFPHIHIIVISGYDEFQYAKQALQCGAKDYLLKPLDVEEIKGTLERIYYLLANTSTVTEKEIILSAFRGVEPSHDIGRLAEGTFQLLLIQIGHLSTEHYTIELHDFYEQLWSSVKQTQLFANFIEEEKNWWLIDQTPVFGKCLVILNGNGGHSIHLSEDLLAAIVEKVAPYPVTICCSLENVSLKTMRNESQILKKTLENSVAPGKSAVFSTSNKELTLPPTWIDYHTQNNLKTFIQNMNRTSFHKEILFLFEYWTEQSYSQRWIEKMLLNLIQFIHHQAILLTDEEIYHTQYELLNILCSSPDFPSVYNEIYGMLENTAFTNEENEKDDSKELTDRIEQYIKSSFRNPISLEDLSINFNYNSSYLTKIFKKHKNITPLKYIITLRINEVKLLIERQPNLSFKEMGAMVGYSDPQYFSRIFKNTTGLSISEYSKIVGM